MAPVVIFDLIGTLFSLAPVSLLLKEAGWQKECWLQLALQHAMAATLAETYVPFREAVEMTLTNLLERDEKVTVSVPEVLDALKNLPPAEGGAACLKRLSSSGYRLAVLTNSSKEAAQTLLKRAEIIHYFTMVISADEVERCKPHPATYRLALDRLDATGDDAWMVAAHAWDIYGAASAGLHTVWVMDADRRWPFPGVPPGGTVTRFTEIPEAVGISQTARPGRE